MRLPLIGAVLTGGASRRFGLDKAPLIGPTVLSAMRVAGVDPVVSVGGATDSLLAPNLADRHPGAGPLGGVATALDYARRGWVLVVPCDHAQLEAEHLRPLIDRLGAPDMADRTDTAVVAEIDGQPIHTVACWPSAWSRPVNALLRSGERRYGALLDVGPVIAVAVPAPAAADADDPEELSALRPDLTETEIGTRRPVADPARLPRP